MSSDREESFELSEDAIGKSDAEKDGSSPTKKALDCVEHASSKGKRRGRRGKKRKQRKSSGGGAAESETQDDSPAWDSDQDFDVDQYFGDVRIRPVDVPKAPENSTQFIMDDHNFCHLYMSFETPNPYHTESGGENRIVTGPVEYDAAYFDVDFKYDPPDDFDSTAYNDKEFELSYKSNRFEQLLNLPRPELVTGLRTLESKLKELSDDLLKENPSPMLEKLQSELLEHQERHLLLLDIYKKNLTGIKNPEDILLKKFGFEDFVKKDQSERVEFLTLRQSRKENQTCSLHESDDDGSSKMVEESVAKVHDEIASNDVQRTNYLKRHVLGNLQQKVDRLQSELEGQCIAEHRSVRESNVLSEAHEMELLDDEDVTCSDMETSSVLRDCCGCEETTEAEKSAPVVV